jgi:hypothetical protein
VQVPRCIRGVWFILRPNIILDNVRVRRTKCQGYTDNRQTEAKAGVHDGGIGKTIVERETVLIELKAASTEGTSKTKFRYSKGLLFQKKNNRKKLHFHSVFIFIF